MSHVESLQQVGRTRSGLAGCPERRIGRSVDPFEIARQLAPLLHWSGEEPTAERRWRLALRAAQFDAWLIAWPQGGRVELHDHGRSRGAIAVLEGSLVEATPWRGDSGRFELHRRTLEVGDVVGFGSHHVHDVVNDAQEHAVSLHVYSPPLRTMGFYEVTSSGLEAREVRAVRDGCEHDAHAVEDVTTALGAAG
jgi:hypothetical protein